jgi:multidrug efflux pump subunit AcrA (membrane-fusion protein)
VPSRSNGSQERRTFVVIDRQVKIGQMIGPASPTPLFILAGDLENMEVHAQVAEGDIGRVKRGLTAIFSVSAFSDQDMEFRGTVKEIRPMPNNVKGAVFYDTVIQVKNQKDNETGEWRLRPGMTAAVDMIRRKHENVWKVPNAALNFQMEEAYQSEAAKARLAEWKVRTDYAEWRPVWVWDEGRRQVWPIFVRIAGLKNGEPGLSDGEFNEILEWEPGREPAAGTPPPRVITKAPPARTPGFFDQPAGIKVS